MTLADPRLPVRYAKFQPLFNGVSIQEAGDIAEQFTQAYVGEVTQADLLDILAVHILAAEIGNVDSRVHCGDCYAQGIGVEQNERIAVQWYRQAAMQRDGRALYQLAAMMERNAGGLVSDEVKEANLYRRAAICDHPEAMLQLGMRLWDGRGVEMDQRLGAKWIKWAKDFGCNQAPEELYCLREMNATSYTIAKDYRPSQS
jgi:TPR repeat protein